MSKILINALQFAPDGAGISKYSHKVAEIIMKNNSNVDILCREEMAKYFEDEKRVITVKINKSFDRILTEQIKLLRIYKKYDIVHFLDYAIPVLYKGKKIATIHDMAMHTMQDKYTKNQVLTKTILMKNTIKNADKLICISNFTKNELLKYYPNVDQNKIEVIYNGFEYKTINLSEEIVQNTLNKFKINKKYLLFVGTISPHKNIERIIEAFKQVQKHGYDYQLVICGKKGWLYEEILKKAKELNVEDYVVFTDYVSDTELEILYQNTELFVFPSLYEGFGFPPIEAMARKIPVLASTEAAIPEIVNDAAIFCKANKVEDISKKMLQALSNEFLIKEKIAIGLKNVKRFSWINLYKKIEILYEDLLSRK